LKGPIEKKNYHSNKQAKNNGQNTDQSTVGQNVVFCAMTLNGEILHLLAKQVLIYKINGKK
jgi:hypothetical protein